MKAGPAPWIAGGLFIVLGLAHALLLPLWAGFDEWLHYSYAAYVSRTGNIPTLQAPSVPREIAESAKGKPGVNDFSSDFVESSWQAQHPPLFYFILSPIYKASEGRSILRTLQAFRIASVLLASLGLIPAYLLFRIFFARGEALAGLLAISAYPATFILFGHMTNDALAFPLFTAAAWLTVKICRDGPGPGRSALLGIFIGAGILAKIYVLTALPAVLFCYGALAVKRREPPGKIAISLLIFFLTASALAGPWIAFNLRHYGTWNPTVHSYISQGAGMGEKLSAAKGVDWRSFIFSNLIGGLWAGNWDFVGFPPFIYKIFAVLIFVFVILGVIPAKAGNCRHSEPEGRRSSHGEILRFAQDDRLSTQPIRWDVDRGPILILILFSLGFLLGLVRHQVHIRSAGNLDTTGAWYWASLLPVHIALLMLILRKFLKKHVFGLLSVVFLAYLLTIWGNWGYLLPYYSGTLDKAALNASFLHSFPAAASLQKIGEMNRIPASALPFLWSVSAALLAGLLWYTIKICSNTRHSRA